MNMTSTIGLPTTRVQIQAWCISKHDWSSSTSEESLFGHHLTCEQCSVGVELDQACGTRPSVYDAPCHPHGKLPFTWRRQSRALM